MKNTNNRNTNCEIIRDLMPLCSEGLCSEDSKALIEEHIRTCEECRKLYEGLPADVVADAAVPEESKALRKVNKKLKFGKAWLILLIALVLGLGYLTVGQFAKVEFIQSFETLWRNVEVYPIARMIAKGDFESFNEWVTTSDLDNLYIYENFDEIRAQDVENLKATYKEAYGDTTVKRIKVRSFYTENYAKRSKLIGSEIEIRYENGDVLGVWLGKGMDGLYYGGISTYDNEKATNFQRAMDFIMSHEQQPRVFTERLLTMEELPPTLDNRLLMIADRFTPDSRETIQAGICAYLDKGYRTTSCTFTPSRYDEEKKMFYYEFTLTGKDDKGTALMAGRMYLDYTGIYPPEAEDLHVYEDGCTPELADALAHFFG